MKERRTVVVSLLILAALAGSAVFFTVEEGNVAVVTVLGRASGEGFRPGLHARWPWPASQVTTFDGRAHLFQGVEEQVLTRDEYSFRVQSYALWKILPEGAVLFYKSVSLPENFEAQLSTRLRSIQNSQFGNSELADIFPTSDPGAGLPRLEDNMRKELDGKCREEYGVEILRAGFTKIAVTDKVLEDVCAKMSSQRRKLSERLKAEGESEAKRIRAEAQAKYDSAIARARGQVKEMLGQAEADSIEAYRSLAKDPELSLQLKKQETLEKLLKERSTIILDPSVPPLDILLSAPQAAGRSHEIVPTTPD